MKEETKNVRKKVAPKTLQEILAAEAKKKREEFEARYKTTKLKHGAN